MQPAPGQSLNREWTRIYANSRSARNRFNFAQQRTSSMAAVAEFSLNELSRCRIQLREMCKGCERSGNQRKILVDRFIDQAIASLMLTFAAEAIGSPCDDETMSRIAESHRALRAAMSER